MEGGGALLERAALLAVLDSHLARAAGGAGTLVLLAGEAGIGKTALARAFCARHAHDAQVLWGACDALRTPRPLGPLDDIARDAGGELAATMARDVPRHGRFTAFLEALLSPLRPVIAVIEDVHWADEATLDLLVFVARRVAGTHAVVIATHRDDELGAGHPLRTVLGNLAGERAVRRLSLPRLSEVATAQLATTHGADASQVYRVTGGNPFFVTELLAAGTGAVPETVRDAVLARAMRLSRAARATLEATAVVPDRAELALVGAVAGGTVPAAIDECAEAGVLDVTGATVHFRHELARLAVEQTISAARLPGLHAAVLEYLAAQPGADLARLTYHAEQAGDRAAVLAHAPAAAAQAARLGAHREAVAHYESALRYADALPAPQHAELLESYAEECARLDRVGDSVDATGQALAIWQRLDDTDRAGAVMARRSSFLASAARHQEAHEAARAAVALLAERPEGPALAAVYTYTAYLHMLASDAAGAVEMGSKAAALAERYGDSLLLARALNAVGSSQWLVEPDQAEETMLRALAAGRESGNDLAVASIMVNLGSAAGEVRRYRVADRWLPAVMTWSAERDLDYYETYGRAWLARSDFEQGHWSRAAAAACEVAARQAVGHVPSTIVALTVLGRLRARRGDWAGRGTAVAGRRTELTEAWRLAVRAGDLQRRWPVAAGRAEAAWLAGRVERIPALVDETYRQAVSLGHSWAIGELAFWRWRAGALATAPAGAAEPYARQIDGDWRAAAAAWEELGCPYEAAVAHADGEHPDHLLAAVESLHRLGARPAADRVIRRLRALGVHRLPRRPHRTTQDNPGGLTDRQLEVLTLVTAGLSNADIAARLHISPRTADHHVSAILGKLGARSRRDAARTARGLGI
jgi:DNA-binding CsgD family transcriptional regulator/tetratricopeptide (TPR) repeat protein